MAQEKGRGPKEPGGELVGWKAPGVDLEKMARDVAIDGLLAKQAKEFAVAHPVERVSMSASGKVTAVVVDEPRPDEKEYWVKPARREDAEIDTMRALAEEYAAARKEGRAVRVEKLNIGKLAEEYEGKKDEGKSLVDLPDDEWRKFSLGVAKELGESECLPWGTERVAESERFMELKAERDRAVAELKATQERLRLEEGERMALRAGKVLADEAPDGTIVPQSENGFCSLCRPPGTVPAMPGKSYCEACSKLLKLVERWPKNMEFGT